MMWEVFVQDNRVRFRVNNQTFTIEYDPDDELDCSVEKQLEWMRSQLEYALASLRN
jgi:hypothetical protein